MDSTTALFRATDVFPSGRASMRPSVDILFERITRLQYRMAITAEELYLVLDEAISNAMEHGNGWDEKKDVTVTTVLDEESLTITVQDQGSGYTDHPSYDALQPLRSRRGCDLFLISSLCPVARNALGNELRISIQRSEPLP